MTRAQGILSSLPCDILVRDHTIQYVQWTLPLKLLPPSAENFHPIMATAGGGEAGGAGLGWAGLGWAGLGGDFNAYFVRLITHS